MDFEKVWPEKYRCCVYLTFDLDAEWARISNDPQTMNMPRRLSMVKYPWDPHVIPRLLDIMDRHDVKSTWFVVGMNAKNHPDIIQEIYSRGHEIATHGWKHESTSDLEKEEERRRLKLSMDAIKNATGERPVGARPATHEPSPYTLDLLWEEGFIYDSTFRGSDLPYRLKKPGSDTDYGLVEIPSFYETDDMYQMGCIPGTIYHTRMLSPQAAFEIWSNSFDGYYKYGLMYTTMFHPQVIGKPGNCMLFDRLLTYIKKFPDVWFATAKQVAEYWIEANYP